ncbi:MAG TPA: YbaN family protein [Acidimicrobiales bacterium]|nr:YbaN family protein [Acidimicrobiales bacterium]
MTEAPARSSAVRAGWLVGGLVCVALGGIGIVVPGLPTTVFFIGAAACFSRSSPRLEAWVLNLRGVGPMVRDHRAGLGMPRRAKVVATACIVLFVGLALWFALEHVAARGVVAVAALVGLAYIWWRVPTREAVLAERSAA